VWIEFQASSETFSGFPPIQKISASQKYVYNIPTKLFAARWWVKTGCNTEGMDCEFGNSVTYNVSVGAQPPLETKFEGTFGNGGTDYFDVSLVDGFSVPFTLELTGDTKGASLDEKIDCSSLSPENCPTETTLGDGGLDLKYFGDVENKTNPLACFSPCKKLNYSTGSIGQGLGLPERGNTKTFCMCCPGPILGESCDNAQGIQYCPFQNNQCQGIDKAVYEKLVSEGLSCRMDNYCGCCCTCASTDISLNPYPIVNTDYVQYCHKNCPVYAWAYDDFIGTITVPTGQEYDIVWTLLDSSTTSSSHRTTTLVPTLSPQSVFLWWWWIIILLVVLLFFLFLFFLLKKKKKVKIRL